MDNSQKVETTQTASYWLMDKQNVIYTYNGISFNNENKWSTDTCYNMNESQKHATLSQSRYKDYILGASIYMMYPE